MSRASRKSELSPSLTKRPSIDLGKDSGVDMGSKPSPAPSVTSGGIGVSTEITNIGGLSVTGGVSVDISPIDLGINYNAAENSLGIAGGAEIPGGLLGASGGVTVNLNTGEITGGSVGVEGLGLGVNISASKEGGVGVEFTVQIPGTPIELSLGFGYQPPKPKLTPTPTPSTPTEVPPLKPATKWTPPAVNIDSVRGCTLVITWSQTYEIINPYSGSCAGFLADVETKSYPSTTTGLTGKSTAKKPTCTEVKRNAEKLWGMQTTIIKYEYEKESFFKVENYYSQYYLDQVLSYIYYYNIEASYTFYDWSLSEYGDVHLPIVYLQEVDEPTISVRDCNTDKPANIYTPPGLILPSPLFPHPPPTRRNMDKCCQDTTKMLREIYKRLGINKFPGQLPATIIQEVPKEGEQPAEPPQVPIEDFVDLLDWQFRRDDERWGQWKVEINVKDTDLTKDGNQGKQIKFPNLAESIGEIEGQILSLTANVDALVALQVKNLAESGMARQEAIKGYLAAKAIIKYMAFKSTETDVPVPMTFTAGAESISDLLKESEGHIKGTDYVEKETLRDVYLDLLQAAAIIRAVHWQKIDTKTDTKSQLLSLLKGTVDLAGLINNPKKSTEGEEKKFNPSENFEDFLDSVEDGFRNATGITDIENPYGKSPDRRPRVRQIGDNISQAGGDN